MGIYTPHCFCVQSSMMWKAVIASVACMWSYLWGPSRILTPIQIMKAGISSVRSDYNLTHLDIKIDNFNTFISGPHCMSDIHSKDEFISIIRPQLNVPADIADDIVLHL